MQKKEDSEKERLGVLLVILIIVAFVAPLLLFSGYDPLGDKLREMFGESTSTARALIFFGIFLVYWFFGRKKR